MTFSETANYPHSYFNNMAFFAANHIMRIFSPNPLMSIFLYDQHDGWQTHLRITIECILLRSRLEDSVLIGALVLLEKFRHSAWPKRPYPDETYLRLFMAAYTLAHRALSPMHRLVRNGFWGEVYAGMVVHQDFQNITKTLVRALNYDTHIEGSSFAEMSDLMSAFITTHTRLRSGEPYERPREAIWSASLPEVHERPSHCEEITRCTSTAADKEPGDTILQDSPLVTYARHQYFVVETVA